MRKQRILILVCTAILLLGIAGSVGALLAPHGTQVEVVQDGTVLYSFDLRTAGDQTLEIEYDGRINTVQIEDGRIRMMDAECPDRTCVHMGWLHSKAMPIVCLPNRLTIAYAENVDGMDAVVR